MVVKVAEYTGTLNCKNCVIIPYSSTNISEKPINHCSSQTFYQHHQNASKTEELWHKQFTRWWNWNWQRKRTSLLKKLHKTPFQNNSFTKKSTLTKNQSVECNLPEDNHKIKKHEIKTIHTSSIKNGQLHQLNCDYDEPTKPIEQFIPVFAKCSSYIKHSNNKSRRKRNKQKERVYEGWMREVSSSDTESEETDVVVKGELRKKSQKNQMHYLSLRLRKLNSGLFTDAFSDKLSDKSREKSITTTKVTNKGNVTEYKSPISGKIYNLNLSKTQEFHIEPVETSYANSKSCTDKAFLTKPEFECTAQYHKIRNEHFELLNSICEIVNKQTEDKIVQSNFDEESHKTSNKLNSFDGESLKINNKFNSFDGESLKTNNKLNSFDGESLKTNNKLNTFDEESFKICFDEESLKTNNKLNTFDEESFNINNKLNCFDEESLKTKNKLNSFDEESVKPNNKLNSFDEEPLKTNKLNTSYIVEINTIKDVTLNESFNSNLDSEEYIPNISRSLPVFMERNPQEIIINNTYPMDLYKNASNSSDLTKREDYYDINYIYNNLDVFKSSITETSFIWDYIKKV